MRKRKRKKERKKRKKEKERRSIACRRRDSEVQRERCSRTSYSSVFHVRFHLARRQYHGDSCAPQNISFSIRAFPPLLTITPPPLFYPLNVYLFPFLCLFLLFRDPRLCPVLYFFRARNHRNHKTPFWSPKETITSSFYPSSPFHPLRSPSHFVLARSATNRRTEICESANVD